VIEGLEGKQKELKTLMQELATLEKRLSNSMAEKERLETEVRYGVGSARTREWYWTCRNGHNIWAVIELAGFDVIAAYHRVPSMRGLKNLINKPQCEQCEGGNT
jgi:hypothetical protein